MVGLLLSLSFNSVGWSAQMANGNLWDIVLETKQSKVVSSDPSISIDSFKSFSKSGSTTNMCVSKTSNVISEIVKGFTKNGCIVQNNAKSKDDYNLMIACDDQVSGIYSISMNKRGEYAGKYALVADYKVALVNQSGVLSIKKTTASCIVK